MDTHSSSPEHHSLLTTGSQARAARAKLIESKAVLPLSDITTALNMSSQELSRAVNAHRLFALKFDDKLYYPAFFADPDLDRSQFEGVSRILGDLSGWEKLQFFLTPKGSLGGTAPLEALKQGKYAEVRRAAKGFAQR